MSSFNGHHQKRLGRDRQPIRDTTLVYVAYTRGPRRDLYLGWDYIRGLKRYISGSGFQGSMLHHSYSVAIGYYEFKESPKRGTCDKTMTLKMVGINATCIYENLE